MALPFLLPIVSDMHKNSKLGIHFSAMRQFKIVCAIIISAFLISSCDKITNPIVSTTTYSTLPTTAPNHVTFSVNNNLPKVLMEDYMGHYCTNCPAAVTAADNILKGPNGAQVVSMEVNVGEEADPAGIGPILPPPGLPDTAYKNDYRTAIGTAWDNALTDCTAQGWPQGMVNRIGFATPPGPGSPDVQFTDWADSVSTILTTMPQAASIALVDSCWLPPQQIIGTQVTVALNNLPTTGYSYYLQLVLVEDSILDWQTNGGTAVQYFPHRFVLRSNINNIWGDEITFSGTIPVTKYYTFTNSNFRYAAAPIVTPPVVPAKFWNMANCYVIAFLYQRTNGNSGNDYQVLQAQIVRI